ncbi:Next to BRCA1 central domain [Trinorchestia longiramus]|nr:Next to BRCA1 central domain [Trinorchestia longiramus]
MEVDDEVEADLLRQFNCLNTSDKEVLIRELQGLLGKNSELSEQSARFYLDMADWNLQAAICAYFDLQSSTKLPQMTFLQDVTIGEGESIPPNTSFVKTWRVENSGGDAWPAGCRLLHTGGERLGAPEASEPLLCLPPRSSLEVSMKMVAPPHKGLYSSKWRMTTHQGHFFGDTIWVILQVDDGGTLALMQQMVNLKELGSSPPTAPPPSPAHAGAVAAAASSSIGLNPFSPNRDSAAVRHSFASGPTPSMGPGACPPVPSLSLNFSPPDTNCMPSSPLNSNQPAVSIAPFPCDPRASLPPDPDGQTKVATDIERESSRIAIGDAHHTTTVAAMNSNER